MAVKLKKQGVLRTFGGCTHVITPIKVGRIMRWWCETCSDYRIKDHQAFIEKKK
jgi:hypothetical protein